VTEFRDPPQEWIAFCAGCGREVPNGNWTPLDELECECGLEGKYERRLRYPPRPASSSHNTSPK
jgi:hypothetical protein